MSESCNHDCTHCSQKKSEEECAAERAFAEKMSKIRHKIVILSGKGGVGKSTVAANLALGLQLEGMKVGLLDVDFHGPSIPTMLGVKGASCYGQEDQILPLETAGVKVMSIDFFLDDTNSAVIWRGPMKYGTIKQMLEDVAWGELDYLIIDCPPGTGDEPLGVIQLLQTAAGPELQALLVTTPQEVSAADVRKSVSFCRQLQLPVVGVVENMSGFVCPHCGEVTYIFKQGGGEKLAKDAGIPFLGRIPLDPAVGDASDAGKTFLRTAPQNSPVVKNFQEVVNAVLALETGK